VSGGKGSRARRENRRYKELVEENRLLKERVNYLTAQVEQRGPLRLKIVMRDEKEV
jgi:hypothetical protein